MKAGFRRGRVGFVGRPNAGKSTLLNQILGTKLAITSSKPQTTRHRISGVHTTEDAQFVLVDTPGIHPGWNELNKRMMGRAEGALRDVDVVCWLVDMAVMSKIAHDRVLTGPTAQVIDILKKLQVPTIAVLNKVDLIKPEQLLPLMQVLSELDLAAAMPLSALTGDGVDALLAEIRTHLPEGEPLFEADNWAPDVTERFLAEEMIREKIFHLTEQEVPYATTVEVTKFDESKRASDNRVEVYANVIVERSTQKGIIIGKKGSMLKRIGTLARKELQEMLECRVYLELYVKVEKDWTRSLGGLKKVGYER